MTQITCRISVHGVLLSRWQHLNQLTQLYIVAKVENSLRFSLAPYKPMELHGWPSSPIRCLVPHGVNPKKPDTHTCVLIEQFSSCGCNYGVGRATRHQSQHVHLHLLVISTFHLQSSGICLFTLRHLLVPVEKRRAS